jgi:hypothetical protein
VNYYRLLILLFLCLFLSCHKQTELAQQLNCKSKLSVPATKIEDFNKNFTINIPNNWKTELYFNKTDSDIYAADTTKELTKSYIINTSYTLGTLDFGKDFLNKIDSVNLAEKVSKTNAFFSNFNNKTSYWYLVKGEKNGFILTELNGYVYVSEKNYWRCSVSVYGEQEISERICEAIGILQSVNFYK